ncbi:MAG TPA: hypothetical protein VN364_04370 [Bellilinea sp.]|nr:hypothetical protein [Bellilinea sp.]
MSAVILITGAISGSIILLYSQWQVIKKGHPWVGMLLGPSFLLICWLFVKFILMPNPKDCDGVSCEWAGVFMVFFTLYLITDLFFYRQLME